MSKKEFNIDVNSFMNNTNDMDSIYAGIPPVENTPAVVEKTEPKKTTTKKLANATKNGTIDHTKTTDELGRVNKKNNYSITFKIDADIEDYLKNILWINRKNKNQYVNDLIREDMLKRLNLNADATYEQIQKEWDKYKKANNI